MQPLFSQSCPTCHQTCLQNTFTLLKGFNIWRSVKNGVPTFGRISKPINWTELDCEATLVFRVGSRQTFWEQIFVRIFVIGCPISSLLWISNKIVHLITRFCLIDRQRLRLKLPRALINSFLNRCSLVSLLNPHSSISKRLYFSLETESINQRFFLFLNRLFIIDCCTNFILFKRQSIFCFFSVNNYVARLRLQSSSSNHKIGVRSEHGHVSMETDSIGLGLTILAFTHTHIILIILWLRLIFRFLLIVNWNQNGSSIYDVIFAYRVLSLSSPASNNFVLCNFDCTLIFASCFFVSLRGRLLHLLKDEVGMGLARRGNFQLWHRNELLRCQRVIVKRLRIEVEKCLLIIGGHYVLLVLLKNHMLLILRR